MGVPKRLTEMQQRFAEFLVFGGPDGPMTKREAAIAAGYSKDRAMREGSELTNPKYSPLVVKHIGELKEERLKKHEVTYEHLMNPSYLLHTRSWKNRSLRKLNRTIIVYIITCKDSYSIFIFTEQPTFTYRCC